MEFVILTLTGCDQAPLRGQQPEKPPALPEDRYYAGIGARRGLPGTRLLPQMKTTVLRRTFSGGYQFWLPAWLSISESPRQSVINHLDRTLGRRAIR